MSQERYAAARAAHQRGDPEGAADIIRALAEEGYAPAQFTLGTLYRSGDGVAPDSAEAARWTRKAAEQGFADAQLSLGWTYQFSGGVTQDLNEAEHWYTMAGGAPQSAREAEERLATLAKIKPLLPHLQKLSHGDLFTLEAGVIRTAVELRTLAGSAAEGLCSEMARSGWMEPIFNDSPAPPGGGAVFRMTEAGRSGIILALETLRVSPEWLAPRAAAAELASILPIGAEYQMRAHGHILAKDLARAFTAHQARDFGTALPIFRALAERDDSAAQFSLGSMLSRGEGVGADDKLALVWYRRAAEQGLEAAEHNLGLFLMYGRGVTQDLDAAETWLRKANAHEARRSEQDLAILLATRPLLPLLNELTLGDLSVLELLARRPADTSAMEGSAKHALYLEMAQRGWLKQKPQPEDWPLHNALLFRSTDLGCIMIPKAMAIHAAWPGRMPPKVGGRDPRDEPRAPVANAASPEWDEPQEDVSVRPSLARRIWHEIERARDDDVSSLRRIATPVVLFAVLLFVALGIMRLVGLVR